MGYYCTVPQCTSLAGKTKNVKFHRFPRDVTMADKWNLILKRGKPYTKYSKVCSLHFTQADYNVTTMGQWKTLSKDAVPSQNLPKLNPDGTVMVIRKSRTVKYREGKKEEIHVEKVDKWSLNLAAHSALPLHSDQPMACDPQENTLNYRYGAHNLNTMNLSPQIPNSHLSPVIKPKKQDAFMQTDPVQSEEDDSQPNNTYAEVSDKYQTEYNQNYQKETEKYSEAKDYTNKPDDYLPQTNEEYNKEAEKYALERNGKSLNGYPEKSLDSFSKPVESYQKVNDLYSGFEKPFRPDYNFQSYPDTVELLRNQQHNLQMLQEPHRITENQNFFNENHIKQEIDINVEDDKFSSYERSKEQLDADMYGSRRLIEQQRLLEQIQHQVKQEPETPNGCENVMQPQGSPYYQSNNHNNVTSGYYDQLSRPGPELLIAKQNALAAHTQLWQNTMKRPFFYSESPHYNSTPILHRYEDISRILQ